MNEFNQQKRGYTQPQGWQQPQEWGTITPPTAADASVSERMGFIRKVYALFFVGTFFAMGGVMAGFVIPGVIPTVVAHPFITFLLMMGGVMAAQAARHVPVVNLVAFFGFTTLTGLVISPFMAYIAYTNPVSIAQAGALTVGIFGGLTAYVFISKKDFSFMRGMLTTGLIVIVLASALNIFLGSGGLGFGVAVGALLLFSGYVLYDTSNIIKRYQTNEYIAGALDLYLDLWNIFLALLRILNAGRR